MSDFDIGKYRVKMFKQTLDIKHSEKHVTLRKHELRQTTLKTFNADC